MGFEAIRFDNNAFGACDAFEIRADAVRQTMSRRIAHGRFKSPL
jgi:hypothetical protein